MKNKETYAKELAGIPFSELAMTKDGKICRCKEILCRDCAFYERKFPFCREAEQTKTDKDAEIARLTAEVAELRTRLGQDEFPCKVGDTIYYINPFRLRPKIEKFKVISLVKEKPNYRKIFVGDDEFFFVGDEGLFFIYNKAEARLKELQGEER